MTFLAKCGTDTKKVSLIKWIHNDFMYIRFGAMRNTKIFGANLTGSKEAVKLHIFWKYTYVHAFYQEMVRQ